MNFQKEYNIQNLFLKYLPSVENLAKKYSNNFIELDDLYQIGSISLWEALLEYQGHDFKSPLNTFLYQKIENQMKKQINLQSKNMVLDDDLLEELIGYRHLKEQLIKQTGENPTLEELSNNLRIPISVIKVLQAYDFIPEKKIGKIKSKQNKNQHILPDEIIERKELQQQFLASFSLLKEKYKIILKLYYFEYDEKGNPLTLEKVGKILNISPEGVRKLLSAAHLTLLKKLLWFKQLSFHDFEEVNFLTK